MNDLTFHTFHLHAHRWVIPGPAGGKVGGSPPGGPGVQNSVLDQGVSQFEDTKIFGPANSFSFTVNQGSFMGPPLGGGAKGEWHMHCHVLGHMMGGMMGSLLIVEGGQLVTQLPRGIKCPVDVATPTPGVVPVSILGITFDPPDVTISAGQAVRWTNTVASGHTVTSNPGVLGCNPPSTEVFDSNPSYPGDLTDVMNQNDIFERTFNTPGAFAYHCKVHSCGMAGTVTVSP